MDLQLTGKRVLITGASKGIGAACAETFLAEGCSVVLVSRDAGRLAAAAQALGASNRVATFAADMSLATDRERVAELHPDIDILVNNAGAIPGGGLLDFDLATWEAAWALKVMGYIHLTQLYLRMMKERGEGAIVNIIGAAGRSPRYDYICGGTGNAALMAFTGAVGAKASEWGSGSSASTPRRRGRTASSPFRAVAPRRRWATRSVGPNCSRGSLSAG